jgi:hypothetical protein
MRRRLRPSRSLRPHSCSPCGRRSLGLRRARTPRATRVAATATHRTVRKPGPVPLRPPPRPNPRRPSSGQRPARRRKRPHRGWRPQRALPRPLPRLHPLVRAPPSFAGLPPLHPRQVGSRRPIRLPQICKPESIGPWPWPPNASKYPWGSTRPRPRATAIRSRRSSPCGAPSRSMATHEFASFLAPGAVLRRKPSSGRSRESAQRPVRGGTLGATALPRSRPKLRTRTGSHSQQRFPLPPVRTRGKLSVVAEPKALRSSARGDGFCP